MTSDPFKVSVFTPFVRRFTDEHARDLAEIRSLYEDVRAQHVSSIYSDQRAKVDVCTRIFTRVSPLLPRNLVQPFAGCIYDLLSLEGAIFDFPSLELEVGQLTMKEQVDLCRFLRAKQYFFAHEQRVMTTLEEGLARIFGGIAELLPVTAETSPFTVPLINVLPNGRYVLDQVHGTLEDSQYQEIGLYAHARDQLYRNLCSASGMEPYTEHRKTWRKMDQSNLPPEEAVDTYLRNTPFVDFFMAPVPLRFTYEDRFSHMHIIGGSGAGKTTLLQNLILNDLKSPDPPSLVVVDSQGDLINKLSNLALFSPGGVLGSKVRMISPKDIKHPPAINIFAMNRDRLDSYDEVTREPFRLLAGFLEAYKPHSTDRLPDPSRSMGKNKALGTAL